MIVELGHMAVAVDVQPELVFLRAEYFLHGNINGGESKEYGLHAQFEFGNNYSDNSCNKSYY